MNDNQFASFSSVHYGRPLLFICFLWSSSFRIAITEYRRLHNHHGRPSYNLRGNRLFRYQHDFQTCGVLPCSLKEVDSENLVFLTLIARVRKDLDEAFRERGEKTAIWESLPYSKRTWIDGTILDTRRALNDIGSYVEDARIDLEQGRLLL